LFAQLARERERLRHGTRAYTREVDDGMARIFVDHGFQWDGAQNIWLTRARASFVLPIGPRFDIRPRGLISRMVGIQGGASSGDPCFDDFFVVKTDDEEPTWNALTNRVRNLLVQTFEDARLLSDGHMVSLWRAGDLGRESDASAALELVSEIVHYRCHELNRLRELPGASFAPAAGAWNQRSAPCVYLNVPTPVRIALEADEGVLVTTVKAGCGRSVAPFWWQVDDKGVVRGNCRAFPVSAASAVPQIGAATVRGDGSHITLSWPGIENDRERLLAGAHLVSAFVNSLMAYLYR
jgi:hypothetical protein